MHVVFITVVLAASVNVSGGLFVTRINPRRRMTETKLRNMVEPLELVPAIDVHAQVPPSSNHKNYSSCSDSIEAIRQWTELQHGLKPGESPFTLVADELAPFVDNIKVCFPQRKRLESDRR